MMSFNPEFAFGSRKEKSAIYKDSNNSSDKLNEYLETKKVICRSLAYLLEYILKELDINIESEKSDEYERDFSHVINLVKLNNGLMFLIDLQSDLELIKVHARTKNFGLNDLNEQIITNEILEEIDKKIRYISKDNNYTDEYYYLLKSVIDFMPDIEEKIVFLLENLNIYTELNISSYIEFRNYYSNMIFSLLPQEDSAKIRIMDLYYFDSNTKIYTLEICFYDQEKYIYLYSNKNKKFEKIQYKKFKLELEHDLYSIKDFPRRRQKSG